jgi:hypothetical protein
MRSQWRMEDGDRPTIDATSETVQCVPRAIALPPYRRCKGCSRVRTITFAGGAMDSRRTRWAVYPFEIYGGTVVYDLANRSRFVDPLSRGKGDRLLVEDFLAVNFDVLPTLERFLRRWGPVFQLRAAEWPLERDSVRTPRWGWTRSVPDGPWRGGERHMRVETNWWASVQLDFSGFAPGKVVYHRAGEETDPRGAPADRDDVLRLRALQMTLRYVAAAIEREDDDAALAAINEQVQWLHVALEQGPDGPVETYRSSSLAPFMFLQLSHRMRQADGHRPAPARCRMCGATFAGEGRRFYCTEACGNAYRVRRHRARTQTSTRT